MTAISSPLQSLVAIGTRLWLDSVDPDLITAGRHYGTTGATSNPIIISDLLKSGRFDETLLGLIDEGLDDSAIAWRMTDLLVTNAQKNFRDVFDRTQGNDGYVSFELDPLLEDASCSLSTAERSARYVELGKQWAAGHANRMIKVPATDAGLGAIEELCAAGITLNITLIFSSRQYRIARDAAWRGAQRRPSLSGFKSVYSVFVSRIDAYTKNHVPDLAAASQGQVGILNAKRIWQENRDFWAGKNLPLQQEMIFASTGTKDPSESADKYVAALAGSDIQTNPPSTNSAIQQMTGKTFGRTVDQMPSAEVIADIDAKVDFAKLEAFLMDEGLKKFADPQKGLLASIAEKRAKLSSGLVREKDRVAERLGYVVESLCD